MNDDVWEQVKQLEHVYKTIAPVVLDFCDARKGTTFHADELRQYVMTRVKTAPSSPDRILRQLRLEGWVTYQVVNRRRSLYAIPFGA